MSTQPLGWTTIEQSKKLIETGLDPDTADMMYIGTEPFMKEFDNTRVCHLRADSTKEKGRWFLPCWSLGKLIDLTQSFTPTIFMDTNEKWRVMIDFITDVYDDEDGFTIDCQSESMIDAIIDAIVILIEHDFIKKGETK